MNLCRGWSPSVIIRSEAKYWQWARIRVVENMDDDHVKSLLESRVMKLVPEFFFDHGTGSNLQLILEFIGDNVTLRLKKLDVRGDSALANIDPGLLSTAALKVHDFTIIGAKPSQHEAIFVGIRDSVSTSLKNLYLNPVQQGPGYLQVSTVAAAAMKLEILFAPLPSPQAEAILTGLAVSQASKLRRLLCGANIHISTLDPEVVAGALTRLEEVEHALSRNLSVGQVSALISRINQSQDLRLKGVYLSDKDLSLVPAEDLVGTIQRLEVATFWWGKMTGEQATVILTAVKEERLGKIKKLTIARVSGVGSVSPFLLQEAKFSKKLLWF